MNGMSTVLYGRSGSWLARGCCTACSLESEAEPPRTPATVHRGPRLGIYWMDRRLPRKSDSVVRIRRYLELYCKDVFEYSTVHVISSTVWYRLRLV